MSDSNTKVLGFLESIEHLTEQVKPVLFELIATSELTQEERTELVEAINNRDLTKLYAFLEKHNM